MPQRYLITTATSAVTIGDGARKVIVVPGNSIVDVSLPLKRLRGLIEATFNGGTVLMFIEDIRQRGRRVDSGIRLR